MSPTDSLAATKAKRAEYIENRARLGWLIHCDARKIYVYRPDTPVEELNDVTEISADPELSGFVLDLHDIWEPNI
jgi:Uma2 family endonuclease